MLSMLIRELVVVELELESVNLTCNFGYPVCNANSGMQSQRPCSCADARKSFMAVLDIRCQGQKHRDLFAAL